MQVLKVLELFKETGTQMALVVDEYGTIEGLVTLNDFLEAVLGDMPSGDAMEETQDSVAGGWVLAGGRHAARR